MGEMFNFLNADSNRPNNKQPNPEGASNAGQSGDQVPQAMDANSDESFDFEIVDLDQPAQPESAPAQAVHVSKQERHFERRKRRRAIISAPVRVRGVDVTDGGPDEILTTTNVSRTGILFHTFNRTYSRGMNLAVTFPYSNISGAIQAERWGRIARISELSDGRQAIAVEFCETDESLVDASGRQLRAEAAPSAAELGALYPEVDAKKPSGARGGRRQGDPRDVEILSYRRGLQRDRRRHQYRGARNAENHDAGAGDRRNRRREFARL